MSARVRLSRSELNQRLLDALNKTVVWHNGLNSKPFELDIGRPYPQRYRAYLYNATYPPGGRALGERKIQLKLPGQAVDKRGNFDHADNRIVLLIGYEADVDVFILWDAGSYRDFPFNMNVQIGPEAVFTAFAGEIALQKRLRRAPLVVEEEVICAPSELLASAIDLRVKLSLERIIKTS